jgi:hypothetical protein
MPPRLLTLGIIAFWLAVVGLFVHSDVWPGLAPAEPQLFPVDVVDEAGHHHLTTKFYVYKNGTAGYVAEPSWLYHPEDDTFESECEVQHRWPGEEAPRTEGPAWVPQLHDVNTKSTYRLTRRGELKEITAKTTYQLVVGKADDAGIKVAAEVTGAPRDGHFVPHLRLTIPDLAGQDRIGPFTLRAFERDGDRISVTARGTVLNPLHPPRRFAELGERQRWRLTVIDPLALLALLAPLDEANGGALGAAGVASGTGASVLDAQVLPDLETILALGEIKVACRVVRCAGDGPVSSLTFWIRPSDGALMKQEAHLYGDVWMFESVPEGHPMKNAPSPRKAP